MLMIFLMAILSLDLIHYSNQNRNSGTPLPDQRTGYGLHRFSDTPSSNSTYKHTTTFKPAHNAKIRRKILVRKRKTRLNDTTSGASIPILSKKKPTPKSDMQVMQFYAQPMPTFDVSYHPPIYENYNPLVNGILNMNDQPLFTTASYATLPTMEPMPFKLPPQEPLFQPMASTWNVPNGERVQRIPIYDPFNILKRKQPPRIRAKPASVAKYIPVRPITPITTPPPITVTHVYKYEETNSGLNTPFDDDPFVENFPALSVALNQHLHDPGSLRGYMTPPKLNQPIYYNMPVVELPTLSPGLQNEYGILHKFNEVIKQQNTSPKSEEPAEYEDSKETQEEKNYSDDDVKKAIEYIQHLKKTQKPNRGSKKFNTDKSEPRRNKKGKKHHHDEESLEENDEATEASKKRTKRPKDFSIEDDDNFQIKSFEELDEEESRKKTVKSRKPVKDDDKKPETDQIKYQESQIVPTLDHEEYEAPPDFSQNTVVGGESNEDRVEFQMHGLQGPESYKFGYDTGKGENRQFRYEERDPDGRVKGHFGYVDNNGKLQVFNYEADPEHGYHLEQAHE